LILLLYVLFQIIQLLFEIFDKNHFSSFPFILKVVYEFGTSCTYRACLY